MSNSHKFIYQSESTFIFFAGFYSNNYFYQTPTNLTQRANSFEILDLNYNVYKTSLD